MPALDFADVLTSAGLLTLAQVILIDLTMAGDNVIIMGTIAAGLDPRERRRVILLGVALALVFLVSFALLATWLLHITGLLLAGGLLLLWVAYNMYRELRPAEVEVTEDLDAVPTHPVAKKSFLAAALQITLADLSMSLDNVIAVAGVAREHPTVLLFGLALSVTLMGLAANYVARLIQRFHWIAWVGLVIILYVALTMVWEGAWEVWPLLRT
ncbi:YjbE family putative metal transport protein [Sphingomonas sp. BN140010]|uniref:YjbE family putative metal transport protein n=1 Tax=Sphingomonas arvum TaxID=2992113 RepID=A0ABT3JF86_9SPHN|nr:YjbE family putative metal transport protein [Sphingomonas sp. BN140010]MCW3797733.1 YjbE family putative metal transport protein [Sphingomonas sp. BN140010]